MSLYKDTDWNFPAFNKACAELNSAGFDTENPADKGVIEGWSWEMYLKYDLKQLLECDGVAVLDQWWLSAGANLEVFVARRLAMPIYDVEVWIERAEA